MKVDVALREFFDLKHALALELKSTVDPYIQKAKKEAWHYQSRVKEEESFALKLETGFIKDLNNIEDLFAGVIVVPTAGDIQAAVDLVTNRFELSHRRPARSDVTHKAPEAFPFDDLRLYVRYKQTESEPPVNFDGMLFEIQIRTFLQHAWSVATHDLTYKSETLNWRRERITFQVKALLEQAEISVENIASLEKSKSLPETTWQYKDINKVIDLLNENWPRDQLPDDIKRLAKSVYDLLEALGLKRSPDKLRIILRAGRAKNGGEHPLDYSPYRAIVNYIAGAHELALKTLLENLGQRRRVFLYPETLEILGISRAEAVAGIFLD